MHYLPTQQNSKIVTTLHCTLTRSKYLSKFDLKHIKKIHIKMLIIIIKQFI